MESVKGNSDRKQNVQMRRVIEDPDSREQPLKILKQKLSVFKEPEHAQIHANARNQPATSCMLISWPCSFDGQARNPSRWSRTRAQRMASSRRRKKCSSLRRAN